MNVPGENEIDVNDDGFLLSEYVSGTLGAAEAKELERRLAGEPDLRAELQRYISLEQELAGLSDDAPADVDYDRQRREIIRTLERRALLHGPVRRPLVFRRVFAPLAAAAAVLLVASATWFVFRSFTRRPVDGQVVVVLLSPGGQAAPGGQVVATLVPIAAAAPDGRVASFEYRKTDFDDIRLTVTDAGTGLPDLPPGTVMVSTGPPPEDEAALLPLGFAGL